MQMKWVVAALALLAIIQVPMLVGETLPASGNEIYAPELFSGLSYRTVGPSRGGRVTAVAGHRDQPSTFYMGASGGGVWKTTDYGHTWHPSCPKIRTSRRASFPKAFLSPGKTIDRRLARERRFANLNSAPRSSAERLAPSSYAASR